MPFNYDDSVRHASQMAKEHGWVMVQDTAWAGYEEVPTWILQGYTTIAAEIEQQLQERDLPNPTHLFMQAGVGSVAGGISGYFINRMVEGCPKIVIVEPDRADCLFRTASANDGKIHIVSGDLDSMMAGLCCGEPCTIAWDIIRECATAFVSCGDGYAARGMQMLGRPMEGDEAVISGESGAVTAAVVQGIMTEERLQEFREQLGLDETSCVLMISTEGDTDRENYRKVLQGSYDL
jgi:diaminopropionate ammonia-lyase